ncbi:hypothetical protein LTR35_009379 [Friedmanniomyces endolithicus]|uniref:Uncharacterized protein n=1 Tax=Friedmanniomyces endolithicus TaxID=329885 RepID=A0AAN6FF10_9PEZI|nr:hypothetical protein LTR35_009379 [Friedmanniomyces endolithicus]KAK0290723.1 hypothetical protein LTS00_008499 [Friedmanniomyces endolithicus]KAK0314238.1 hypothetical protein LTR82_013163 [Friedmanniomyces endolithicus]KAK0997814.1 hypothetical protein LTR54_009611 [Friedmanniomyces endolithicus]
MSDGLNPSGPAQPNLDQVYETEGNPASKAPAEDQIAQKNANDPSQATDKRIPREQSSSTDEATPSSLAQGIHGAPPGEEAKGLSHEDVGRHNELEPEALGTYAEDKVADAVKGTQSGSAGKEQDMASDLDRKKAEQAPAREKVQKEEAKGFDVGGVLGQRGGPVNPVD